MTTDPISHAEMIAAVKRQIAAMENLYDPAAWPKLGEAAQQSADRSIATMRAVLAHLERTQWRPIEEAPFVCGRAAIEECHQIYAKALGRLASPAHRRKQR